MYVVVGVVETENGSDFRNKTVQTSVVIELALVVAGLR